MPATIYVFGFINKSYEGHMKVWAVKAAWISFAFFWRNHFTDKISQLLECV